VISEPRREPGRWWSIAAVFVLSAGLVGFELTLIRALAVTQWHHFSYFVISTALLGFGVSGTLLAFVGRRLARRFNVWATMLTLAFALSVYVCFRAAQALPLNPQFVLFSGEQAGLLIVYHVLLLVPFLLGATVIGLALIHFGNRIHLVYGSNLLGSGIGGLGALLLMSVLPVERILLIVGIAGLVAGAGWAAAALPDCSKPVATGARCTHAPGQARVRSLVAATVAVGVALAVLALAWPMVLRIDSHKPLATALLLEKQGDAEHLLTRSSPRARLDVFASPLFHNTLFAGFTALSPPPSQLTVYVDGWSAGTVFRIDEPGEAEILDHTLMSVPYRLLERPRVLLLGEVGGANVWLAERWNADSVTVVNGNPQLVSLIAEELAELSGGVFARRGVETVAADPRLFLEAARQTDYDLIQLVSAEGMSVGVSGLLAIHEDYLLTREGLAIALRRLRPGGLMAVTRQQQDPPRDNVKLLLTLAESLESLGVSDPGAHIVQLRNYLAVITLASRGAFSDAQCEKILAVADKLQLDVEWLPMAGFEAGEPHARIPGPPGESISYYRYAAQEAFSPRRGDLIDDWVFDIRPATDERPYFYNFFRWGSIAALREAFGGAWFRKLELGYVAVVAILAEVVLVGGALILLPLLFRGRQDGGSRSGRLATGLYFFLLGLAYMSLEMLLIVRFSHFLGDPILSAGGVVSSFLVLSGLGSLLSRRLFRSLGKAIAVAVAGICALGAAYAFVLPSLFAAAASWSTGARMVVTVLLAAPLAFLMGIPFPSGMRRISQARPAFVPWAWGINGFASVAAPPIGILLATSIGLTWATLLGGGLYLCAGLLAPRLPKR
jgi:spermidine synthase